MDEQPGADHPSHIPLPPPPDAEVAPAGPSRRRGNVLIAGVVVAALLLGGGVATAFLKMRGSGEVLFTKVPASSDIVFSVYLDPSAGQKANLFLLASRFPELGSAQELTGRFNGMLDQSLASAGLGHGDLSWVGDQVAFVVDVPASLDQNAAPQVALLIDIKDEGAAEATLQRLQSSGDASSGGPITDSTVDGVSVTSNRDGAYAVFDGTIVVTNSLDEMASVVATAHGHQPALEGSSGLQAATAGLPEGRVALLYVNPRDLLTLVRQLPGVDQAKIADQLSTLQAITGLAMTVSVQPDGVAVDAQAITDPSKLSAEQRAQMDQPDHPNPLLASIPADAFAVASAAHLDTSLASTADRMAATSPRAARMLKKLGVNELIAALDGDVAFEASADGGSGPGAAMVLGTKDAAAMQRALDTLAEGLSSLAEESSADSGGAMVLTASSSRWATNDYHGVTIHTFQMAGVPDISYAVVDRQGIVGTSAVQVERIVDTERGGPNINSSAAYKTAIASVPSSDGSVWVNVEGIVQQIRQVLPPQEKAAFDRDTLPNLAPLKAFVVGTESDASHERVRMFLGIG